MAASASPRVTVLMTLYNKGPFVEEAVRSVLAGTYTDLELLVVDDASTDGGVERVRSVQDPRIRLLTTERNAGRPTAANRGYDAARGEFVAVLDADDIMHPERLAKQVAYLDANPEVGVVGTSLSVFGAKDELWNWPEKDEQGRGGMLFSDPVCYGTCMIRRAVLEEHHLRCDTDWRTPGMDYLFLLKLAPYVRYANIHEALTFYRVGEQNMRHGRDPIADRARIYRRQFELFGLPATEEEVRLQLMLHRLYVHAPDLAEVWALYRWKERLKRMVRRNGVFPTQAFEAEVERRWRRIFHPIADRGSVAALLHLLLGGGLGFGTLRYLVTARLGRLRGGNKEAERPDTPIDAVAPAHVSDTVLPDAPPVPVEELPRITLVTPSFQQAGFLEECLTSVRDQRYPHLEHFVVDGGSTDGSVSIIEQHANDLAWWCSEKDGGQSDAISKGAARGTGRVFAWLNSDDILLPGALLKVGEAFARDPHMKVLCGARILRFPDGDRSLEPEDAKHPETFFTAPRINQQSTFFRMDTMRELDFVERKLHYVMDYELWLQVVFRHGPGVVRTIPDALSVFRQHSDSKTSTVHHRFLDEIASILHGLCGTTGQHELAAVLAIGHPITPGLRGIPLADPAAHRERVRAMVLAFLLKWHYTIWSARDFRMMRRFRRTVSLRAGELSSLQQERLRMLDRQLHVPGWVAFRLRRKWKHLVR